MDGRIKRVAGLSRRRPWVVVATAMAATWVAIATTARAQDGALYAQGRTHSLHSASDEVHVQLTPSATVATVSEELEAAGFGPLEELPGISGTSRIFRLSSEGLSEDARALIRTIGGVSAVRPAYTLIQFDLPLVLSDEVVVRLNEPGTAQALADTHGLRIGQQLEWLGEVYVMHVDDGAGADPVQTAAAAHNDPRSVYAHVNPIGLHQWHDVQINDPFFEAQWHLENIGADGGRVGADVRARQAWEITQGEGILVAVIDTAFDLGHEDLAENYSGIGFDVLFGTDNPAPLDGFPIEAHGTAVAGLICAVGNGVGVRGVAPKAKFIGIGLHFFGLTPLAVAQAFNFAAANGADMINASFGGPIILEVELDAIRNVALTGRSGRGTLVVFAAGNDGTFVQAVAAQPQIREVMAVGALLRDGTPSCYTNFGPEISMSAPGGGAAFVEACFTADVVTTDLVGDAGFNPGGTPLVLGGVPLFPPPSAPDELANLNYTNGFNGTSAAAPVMVGVAALALSVNPDLTRTQLRNLLEHTATKDEVFRGEFDVVTGHNIRHGHGRANALAAVEAARRVQLWPSPVDNLGASVAADSLNLFWDNPTDDVDFEVLVVRSAGTLEWAPKDLETYEVGDLAVPGVRVVAKASIERFQERIPVEGPVEFGVFVRNSQGRYSWGRRMPVVSTSLEGTLRVTATATPTLGAVPLTVEFFGGADVDTDAVSFEWRLGDALRNESGGLIRAETIRFGRFVNHTYTKSGAFQARLIVTDSEGQTGSATVLVQVEVANQAPIVDISADPITGFAPLAVTFTAGGSDPDGRIRRFLWDFGDRTTAEGQIAEHIYEDPGVFAVTLTALDDSGGTSLATVEIVVNGAGGTTGTEVSGANTAGQGAPTSPLLPGFCGSLGIEALALTAMGLLAVGLIRRRRD